MKPIYYDTETCGLVGPIVLLQFAEGENDIQLHDLWLKPIYQVIDLIEYIVKHPAGNIGFNLTFDHFHLCQMYTTLILMKRKERKLIDAIDEYVECEEAGRDGPCLKPVKACDLMLLARRSHYQNLMDRRDIRIRKVPSQLAFALAERLEEQIPLKEIFFARRKRDLGGKHWQIFDRRDEPEFKDVVLKFASSSGLKALAIDALGLEAGKTIFYADIQPDVFPEELNYAPYVKAAMRTGLKKTWPTMIRYYAQFWSTHAMARQYAEDDVKYTRALYHHFGNPPLGDTDSELACMVGAVRWKGYTLDIPKLTKLKEDIQSKIKSVFDPDHVPTAPTKVKDYLKAVLDPIEQLGLISTNKKILADLAKNDPLWEGHPVRERAQKVIQARDDKYLLDLFKKLIVAGRFHVDSKVGGTLSGRMSGGTESEGRKMRKGSINAQGIPRNKKIRACFPLAHEDTILCGGDLESFEVALAAACYDDPDLTRDLSKCWMCEYIYKSNELTASKCPGCGQSDGDDNTRTKIHGLFGMALFPGKTYAEIRASKGSALDLYDLGKRGVFATVYGGNANTLVQRLQIELEIAEQAINNFMKRYKGVRRFQLFVEKHFCSMKQLGGIGSKVTWDDPDEYIESMLGYRRYFTLENAICKALFDLAENPPKSWRQLKIPVIRRDRVQLIGGALQSAVFACAFNIQSFNMRAAGNHKIQSTGAQITKEIQKAIWDHQPSGIHKWVVQPYQIHDEIMVPTDPAHVDAVTKTVYNKLETYRELVPMIAIGWKTNIPNWSEK